MANAADYKEIREIGGSVKYIEFDLDVTGGDSGATGALTLCKFKEAMVIHKAHIKVKTAFTSGGSATLIIGTSGDTDAVLASTAVAALTAPQVSAGAAASLDLYVAADETILSTIGTAAMTAGKLTVVMEVSKF